MHIDNNLYSSYNFCYFLYIVYYPFIRSSFRVSYIYFSFCLCRNHICRLTTRDRRQLNTTSSMIWFFVQFWSFDTFFDFCISEKKLFDCIIVFPWPRRVSCFSGCTKRKVNYSLFANNYLLTVSCIRYHNHICSVSLFSQVSYTIFPSCFLISSNH